MKQRAMFRAYFQFRKLEAKIVIFLIFERSVLFCVREHQKFKKAQFAAQDL